MLPLCRTSAASGLGWLGRGGQVSAMVVIVGASVRGQMSGGADATSTVAANPIVLSNTSLPLVSVSFVCLCMVQFTCSLCTSNAGICSCTYGQDGTY